MLGALHRDWAPAALAVSFKLETDEQLLVDKVRRPWLQGLGVRRRQSFGITTMKRWPSSSSRVSTSTWWWPRYGI